MISILDPSFLSALATPVLLIDGSQNQRAYWADQLKRCSPDYEIVEAANGQSGLDLTDLGGLIACCSNSGCLINRSSKYW